ncbi:Alpha/Beta hydrolase protein [Lipomyces arxii]|uniref:Alpha/Beta hydrolase protein n=1 Tax=Lipomyces arxii TaxID=56418 RepID=UPI0034CFC008
MKFSILFLFGAVSAYTYDELLEAPRRSGAVPNAEGSAAVFSERTYSFESKSWSGGLKMLSMSTGATKDIVSGSEIGGFAWGAGHDLLYLNDTEGTTGLWAVDVESGHEREVYSFAGNVDTLKTKVIDGGLRVVVSGWADEDGELVRADRAPKPDSGLLYDSIFVRHWDYWLTGDRMSVFGLVFSDKFEVKEELKNYLKGTGLESPIMPFPSGDDIVLGEEMLIVNAKAPELNPANNTATYFYSVKYTDDNVPVSINKGVHGACSSPALSKDGKLLAGLVQAENGYESDQNVVFVYNLATGNGTRLTDPKAFDRSPSSVMWSSDESEVLYLIGEDKGKDVVWKLTVGSEQPVKLSTTHSVLDASNLGNGRLLLSSSAIVKSTYFELYVPESDSTRILLDAASSVPESRVGEFWFGGSRGETVHGFLVYPTDFDPTEKYPLAFLIHGGPQSAWTDSWSTRWNPVVWSDAGLDGYVVVTINPTGSTGYGKDFTDKIQNNWGSYPYIDLVLGLEYVVKEFGFIDTERMIAAGASYGGYMINWIQGSALGRVFKALVTHDGVFSTLNQYASEELYFPTHDFGGSFVTNTRGYYRYNPMSRMYRWATPHFIVHNAKDYRLPESEGLIAFNVLQELGVPSKLLHFPDENHWVLKPENSRRWHKEIFAFINQYSSNAKVSTREIESCREKLRQIAENVDGDVALL